MNVVHWGPPQQWSQASDPDRIRIASNRASWWTQKCALAGQRAVLRAVEALGPVDDLRFHDARRARPTART